MSAEAYAVHGLFQRVPRRQNRLFAHVVGEFLEFIGDAAAGDPQRLVRYRLPQRRAWSAFKRPPIARERLVDTLLVGAAAKHPGVSNRASMISARAMRSTNSRRTKHGALLDAELLAEVLYRPDRGRGKSQLILATESRDIRIDGLRRKCPRRQAARYR